MAGLWTDVWFYVSSFGLLVSGFLFFFLLSQYRAAAAAADRAEPEAQARAQETDASATTPVQFVYAMPDSPAIKTTVASVAEPRPADVTLILSPDAKDRTVPVFAPEPKTPAFEAPPPPPAPRAPAAPAPSEDVPQPSPSPAAAYLQGLKGQLDALQQEVHGLSGRLDAANRRDEAMIARLAEIAQIVTGLKQGAGASTTPQLSSERETLKELPYDFDEKMHNGISAVIDAHFGGGAPADAAQASEAPSAAETAASPAETTAPSKDAAGAAETAASAAEPESGEPSSRRGPVWPV